MWLAMNAKASKVAVLGTGAWGTALAKVLADKGMLVEVPLALHALPGKPSLGDVRAGLAEAYGAGGFVRIATEAEDAAASTLDPEALNGSNGMDLHVFGSESLGQARLVAILDNLGKGAAVAAVQNLNLMLGLPEDAGLITQV